MDAPDAEKRPVDRVNIALALFAIVIFALLFRVFNLPWESPTFDETRVIAQIESLNIESAWAALGEHDAEVRLTPIPYLLHGIWIRIFGDSVPGLRMFSVTCSLGTIWLVFLIARRLHGSTAALAAAMLAAVSLPHIFTAQHIGSLSIVSLFVLLSMYCFVRATHDGGFGSWTALLAVDTLLLWIHPAAALVWMSQGMFLLMYRRPWRVRILAWVLVRACLVVLFLAWAIGTGHLLRPVQRGEPVTLDGFYTMLLVFAGGRFSGTDPAAYMPAGISFDRMLAVGIGLVLFAYAVRTNREIHDPELPVKTRRANAESFLLWSTWAVLPPLALAVANIGWDQPFDWRLVLFASFALYLPAGAFFTTGRGPGSRAMLAAIFIALFAAQLTVIPGGFRPDYRSAADFLLRNGQPLDRVLVLGADNAEALRFDSPVTAARVESFPDMDSLISRASNRLAQTNGVWLVICDMGNTDSFEARLKLREIAFKRFEFGGHPPLWVYWVRWYDPEEEPVLA